MQRAAAGGGRADALVDLVVDHLLDLVPPKGPGCRLVRGLDLVASLAGAVVMGGRKTPPAGARAHQHERAASRRPEPWEPPIDRSRPLPDAYRGELGERPRPIDPKYARLREADRTLRDHGLLELAMRRRQRIATAVVIAWVLIATLIATLCALHARAQRRPTDVEQLARIVVHETGWEDTGDAEAIYAVLVAGGAREGITWQAYARRYSRRLHRGEVSRRWAAELTEDCERPSSWPRSVTVRLEDGSLAVRPHPGWGAYVERCQAAMARVREVLAGERVHHCEREPHDWGGRVDRARAARLGLLEIDCSAGDVETVGDYYVRPSLLRGAP